VSALQLRGFILPGRARPTFVIPWFGSRGSNQLFVQELDADYRIARFLVCDPYLFDRYEGPVPVVERTLGQPGILAFVDRDDRAVTGTAGELRAELGAYRFDWTGADAFFAVEVMEFRGDRAGLERAIATAAARFSNPALGSNWQARELAVRSMTPAVPDRNAAFDDAVARLRESFGAADWVERFGRVQKQFGASEILNQVALDWLEERGIQQASASDLILLTVPSQPDQVKRFGNGEALVEKAHSWVTSSNDHADQWPQIWRRVFRLQPRRRDDLIELGTRYLTESVDQRRLSQKTGLKAWLDIWQLLWLEDTDRRRLFAILDEQVDKLKSLPSFGKAVQLVLIDPVHRSWAIDRFEDWIVQQTARTDAWERVCLDLLKDPAHGSRFASIAIGWLREPGQMTLWHELWTALAPYIDHDDHLEFGHQWLLRGQIGARAWPDLLVALLEAGFMPAADEVRVLARQWLAMKKMSRARARIAKFVEG
jgi:hypothetical protein